MEHWKDVPWSVGEVFPAPQLLTGASALPLGPLFFDGIGKPQRLISTGWQRQPLENPTPNVTEQTEEFLCTPGDAYFPEALVEEHLQEDNAQRIAMIANSSQLLGNRLQLVECRDGVYAAFFPTGQNLNCVGGAHFLRNEDREWHVSGSRTDDGHPCQPTQDAWFTSPSLRYPIFQLSAIKKDPWDPDSDYLIAARSLYKVQLLTARTEDVQITFTYPMAASFEKYVSHVAWNQHLRSEAAVVLETGEVLLFDLHCSWSATPLCAKSSFEVPRTPITIAASQFNRMRDIKKKTRAKVYKRPPPVPPPTESPPFDWWQCEFAWHPKILLVAGSREVVLMDFRVKHGGMPLQGSSSSSNENKAQSSNSTVVARVPGVGSSSGYGGHGGAKDRFLAFARANYDGGYEFCTSSQKNLFLFDTRRPKTLLLQWAHGMDGEPPGQLTMCPISAISQQSSATASEKGKVILAAAPQSGNIEAFCYGGHPSPRSPPQSNLTSPTVPSHLDERLYAWELPSKVFAPQAAPNDLTAILGSPMNFFQEQSGNDVYMKRPRENIAGLVVLPSDGPGVCNRDAQDKEDIDRKGFSLLQLTGEGDILVQQYQAADKLQIVGFQTPLLQGYDTQTSNRGMKDVRAVKFLVENLSHFYSYIRTGSGLTEADRTIFSEHYNNQATIRLDGISHYPHDSASMSQSDKLLSNDNSSKEGDAERERDSIKLHKYLKHLDPEKMKALVAETTGHSNVPLSVYEIAHKVLRLGLPADLARLAAGMPADVSRPLLMKYKSADGSNPDILKYKSRSFSNYMQQRRQRSFWTVHLEMSKNEEKLMVPLPVVLECCSAGMVDIRVLQHDLQENDTQKHLLRQELSVTGQCTGPSVETSSSVVGHAVLQSSYEYVQRAVDELTDEGRSREIISAASLADPNESWCDTPAAIAELDRLHLFQYQILRRDMNVDVMHHDKVMWGHPMSLSHVSEKNQADCLDADMSGVKHLELEGSDGKSQASDLERDAFCTFVGEVADRSDVSLSGSQQVPDEDSSLCPINLPFLTNDEAHPEEFKAMNSLRTQFKQWQQNFVPYRNFCQENLPNH